MTPLPRDQIMELANEIADLPEGLVTLAPRFLHWMNPLAFRTVRYEPSRELLRDHIRDLTWSLVRPV